MPSLQGVEVFASPNISSPLILHRMTSAEDSRAISIRTKRASQTVMDDSGETKIDEALAVDPVAPDHKADLVIAQFKDGVGSDSSSVSSRSIKRLLQYSIRLSL